MCQSVLVSNKTSPSRITELDYLRRVETYNKESVSRSKKQTPSYNIKMSK